LARGSSELLTSDARRILTAQAARAFAYGFTAVLLGSTLEARGWSPARVGALLATIVIGTALVSLVIGRFGNRLGRRPLYLILYLGLAACGLVFAFAEAFWILALAGLTGTMSPEVVESGPFTSLEQSMLPSAVKTDRRTRIFGTYNATATIAGSMGALAAGLPALLRRSWSGVPADHWFFLLLVPAGLLGAWLARSLSQAVEEGGGGQAAPPLGRSRRRVIGLAGLFALDSFAGGFVLQAFIVYWLRLRFGASLESLAVILFAVGLLQAASFVLATRVAERVGLLNTMVFTHLPSNILLAAIPLASNLPVAAALLFARSALSQMDVPTRQAYVVALVDPDERTAAAAYTNTARYAARPLGPALAGAVQEVAMGMPFFIAGAVKSVYDLALYLWFRRVPLATTHAALTGPTAGADIPGEETEQGRHSDE